LITEKVIQCAPLGAKIDPFLKLKKPLQGGIIIDFQK